MTIPVWVLLLFAGWTLGTSLGTVGFYRWSRILTGRAALSDFRADEQQGSDWYRRAMRAHANCVENLPVYAGFDGRPMEFAMHCTCIGDWAAAGASGPLC